MSVSLKCDYVVRKITLETNTYFVYKNVILDVDTNMVGFVYIQTNNEEKYYIHKSERTNIKSKMQKFFNL